MEIAALAATVVGSILGPFLQQGAEQLANKLRDKASDTAASGIVNTAKKLWNTIRGKAAGTDKEAIVNLFEEKPELMQASMKDVLEQMLSEDPKFREEVGKLVEGGEGGAERWQLIGDTVGVFKAHTVSGGYNAGVMVNASQSAGQKTEPAGQKTEP